MFYDMDGSPISHHTGATSSTLFLQIVEFIPRHVHRSASQMIYMRMLVDQALNLQGIRSSMSKAKRKLTTGTRGNVGSIVRDSTTVDGKSEVTFVTFQGIESYVVNE